MLYIRLDVPDEFAEVYNKFNSTKIGKKLLELSGIARKQLDAVSFTREYFSSDYVADMSVDPNANVGNSKNPSNYSSEISKPINKFCSYVLILEYLQKLGLDKKKAQSLVKRIILGDFYPHDQAKWNSPYCVATSTYNLMIEGRPYYQLHSLPPKRTDSFIKQATEFVMDLSNDFAGACALGDLIINYAYYLANEPNKTDKEIENDFQGFVHIVNNPFRDSNQSPFTNVSFFDEPTLRLVFKDYYYPNGKSPLEEPYFSLIKRVQNIFMKFLAKKDPKTGMPYRFPIASANILVKNGEIIDKKFFEQVCELNKEGVFNIYINDDGNARIASCCFHPDQKVLVKSSTNGIELVKIGEFIERPAQEKSNWRVYHNGSWVKASAVRVPYDRKWYKITTSNKKQLIVTDDHIHVTLDGEKKTTDLKVGDYLMFSTYPIVTAQEKEYHGYDYLDGLVIGAFLGDGSYRKNHKDEVNGIIFCLNPEKLQVLKPIIELVANRIDENASFHIYSQRETSITLTVNSKEFAKFVTKFVGGIYNYERYPVLDTVLRCSYAFRKGLIDGLYLTDGGNSNRIYTTSEKMIENLEAIFTSLGIPTVIDVSDRRDEPVVIHGQEFPRNFKLYCIRFYSISHTRDYVDLYKIYNNSIYFKVVKIEEIENNEGVAYCFEMKNQNEPYFTLPNGIITHNCRLTNDITELMKFKGIDSFGNGGLNIGCYDDQTEVLTDNGWKLFKDLTKDDYVLTLNMKTRTAEFQKPTAYFEYNYEGIMHHYCGKNIDLLVTPNHNMFLESRKTKELLLKRSDSFGTGYNLPTSGFHINKKTIEYVRIGNREYPSKAFCKLVGLFIADGSVYLNDEVARRHGWEIRFFFKKKRKINYLERILKEINAKYFVYKKGKDEYTFCIYEKEDLHKFFRTFYTEDRKKCINKKFMLSLGFEDLKCLFDGLIEGDGYRQPKFNSICFYTSSDQLKDDFCMLCSLIGFQTTVRNNGNPRCRYTYFKKENRVVYGKHYEIVVRHYTYLHRPSKYRKEVPYKGKVYCVEVPNHVLMVRRKGKTCWCGNSHRVITINLPRIALECKIKNLNLEKLLLEKFDEACALVISHRLLIKDRIEQNFLKFFKPLHWLDLDRMFYSTIGLVGFYEFCEILGWDIVKTEGRNKLKKILKLLNDRLLENAQKYGVPMNMEQIPGESAAITLAKKDNVLFKTNYVMYSNQFVPLWHDILLTQRMEIDGELDEYFGGGVISHLNIGSKLTKDQVAEVIKYAIKCGLKHFALNPKFAVCKNKHITLSSGKSCPTCGAEIVDYVTRIVGYFVPVSQWVKERREWEFPKRKWQSL